MADGDVRSEDVPGEKWDRCLADAVIKTGAGIAVGSVFSLLMFKRRFWPIAAGSGFGIGFSVSNCQHEFKRVESLYLRPKPQQPDQAS